MNIKMKKIYVDTSDVGEVKQKKLDDKITIGYDENGNIVGIEINNPIGLDIDDEEFNPLFETFKDMDKNIMGIA
tara:strand:- start:442 stop:663 length:222 start_codon:yes stop_codon:yes gene_type:complete